ncbi:MAG: 2-succinyl-5-enolpyruvyl-6-hydroxy-3-cyclohexene-1-carboxylic-acid synthase [Acidimicrobiia bacterium]
MTAETNPTSIGCRDLVSGLADAGVTIAFVSPGSRHTPLVLALAAEERINDISIRDERSAGFMALGWAKATESPAIVVSTSGSAATHYYPSIVEADQAGVPMIVVTADRPLRLRGTSAPQTLDQEHLYTTHVKAFVDIDISAPALTDTAIAAVATATDGIPGPVHLNVPLDEPLTPSALTAALPANPIRRPEQASVVVPDMRNLVEGRRVLIIAGGGQPRRFPAALGRYASALGASIFADPQCRPASDGALRAGDALAGAGMLDRLPPDVVLRFGPLPISKPVATWLTHSGVPQILVGRSRLEDPLVRLGETQLDHIDIDPLDFVASDPRCTADHAYLAEWVAADRAASIALVSALEGSGLTEPLVARTVMEAAPSGSIVFGASSMPIRDLDRFGVARPDVTVLANRGVNGIDGSISTAIGCALTGTPTVAVIGDIAALHDLSGLSELARLQAPLTVVVINNDGGGIFSFLPQRTSAVLPDDLYERHWGTPHGFTLIPIATSLGVTAARVERVDQLRDRLNDGRQPGLVEIQTDRSLNAAVHDTIQQAVSVALAEQTP